VVTLRFGADKHSALHFTQSDSDSAGAERSGCHGGHMSHAAV